MFIPISKPSISQLEIDYVTDAVKSTWISSLGKYIEQFESEFAKFCEAEYAISVSNGTVALHLALAAFGIGNGDEVIVPDISFIATANAVKHIGATPVFVDIDVKSLCIDPEKIEAAITSRTKAIIPVHLYGHPANMNRINEIARKYSLRVIEDAAEAHGAEVEGKRVGSLGHCATFSFYGNKNLTTGEGGMITTNDKSFAEKCKYLRDHAMSKEKRYWHTELGFNFRMTNLQAALGCAQLERANEIFEDKERIFLEYQKHLCNFKEGLYLNRSYDWAKISYWLVCLEFEGWTEDSRDVFMQRLKERGVDSRPYFYPMSMMPYFESVETNLVSYKKYQQGINLPTYFGLSNEDIALICEAIKSELSESVSV